MYIDCLLKDCKVATKEKTSEAKQHRTQVHYSTHTEQTQRHTDTKTKHAHKTTN